MLGGHQAEIRRDGATGEAVPVADLGRESEPGQRGDAAQAAQSVRHSGERGVRRHRGDVPVQPVPAGEDTVHGVIAGVERRKGAGPGAIETLAPHLPQPRVVSPGPGSVLGIDKTAAKKQLAHPVSGGQQIRARVIAGADQIPGRFLGLRRDTHRDQLVHLQQPGQQHCVPGVGLDPVAGRSDDLRRRRDRHRNPCRLELPSQPETGRPSLVSGVHRTQPGRDLHHPREDIRSPGGQPRLDHLTGQRVDRRRSHAPRVHIQTNSRTLVEHQGLRCMSASQGHSSG